MKRQLLLAHTSTIENCQGCTMGEDHGVLCTSKNRRKRRQNVVYGEQMRMPERPREKEQERTPQLRVLFRVPTVSTPTTSE